MNAQHSVFTFAWKRGREGLLAVFLSVMTHGTGPSMLQDCNTHCARTIATQFQKGITNDHECQTEHSQPPPGGRPQR